MEAKDVCKGIGNSHDYYKPIKIIGWNSVKNLESKSIQQLNALGLKRAELLEETANIFREFCSYDGTHWITKNPTREANEFKNLIQEVYQNLESLRKDILAVKKKYNPPSVSASHRQKRSKCCWPFKLCCK